jgi:RNA polymerase sigma factor (sigma-70 family)
MDPFPPCSHSYERRPQEVALILHGEDGGMLQDVDLIRSAQAADQEAFRALVERYRLPVLRTARILLADAAQAEDVAQEAWVNAWRALGQFNLERPFRPWILRIVANCCRMELRRSHGSDATLDLVEPELLSDQSDLLADVVRREEYAALDDAISSLPPAQRQIVALRYRADLDLGEIVLVTGLPLGTAKSRLSRALAAIRERVASANLANPDGVEDSR